MVTIEGVIPLPASSGSYIPKEWRDSVRISEHYWYFCACHIHVYTCIGEAIS